MSFNAVREFNPIPKFLRSMVQGQVGKRLQQMGLFYHDIIAETPVLTRAISRLPAEVQERRIRRIRRAIDLGMKKQYLPEEAWEDPWQEFDMMSELLAVTQREHDERMFLSDEPWATSLGAQPWYAYDLDSAWFWKDGADAKPPAPTHPE